MLSEKILQEMVTYAINFAYNDYVKPNAVPNGSIADAILYFAQYEGNLYDTPGIRIAVAEIIEKAFTETEALPYPNPKDAGQIILAGPLGSAATLLTRLGEGEGVYAQLKPLCDAAVKHSIRSDFSLFKKELSDRKIHGYTAETHAETFSRIRGLCSGLDNAIQRFSARLGYGAITDNTLAPVTEQQQKAFYENFPKLCATTNVTVIGLALTPEEAAEQHPAAPEKAIETAKAFAAQSRFIQDHATNLALISGGEQIIYSHCKNRVEYADVNVEAVTRWKRANGVEASKARIAPRFPYIFDEGPGLFGNDAARGLNEDAESKVRNDIGRF